MADKRKNKGKLKAFKESKEAARAAQRKELAELDEFYKDYNVLVKGPKLPKLSEEEMPKPAPGRFSMTISPREYRKKFLLAEETAEEAAWMEEQEKDSDIDSDDGSVPKMAARQSSPSMAGSEDEKVAVEREHQQDDKDSTDSVGTIPPV